MTKYDPYQGLKPNRRRTSKLSSTARSGWGVVAASAIGLFFYNQRNRGEARSGGSFALGVPASVELTQDSGVGTLVSHLENVSPNGSYDTNFMLNTSQLNVNVTLTKQERAHKVIVIPYVAGRALSINQLSTTDANGIASVTFTAEDMNIIKNEGTGSTNSVIFRIVVDGAYADSVNLVCPIGA